MDEAPLLGGVSGPEDEMVTDLFGAESQFVSENLPLKTAGAAKHEDDEFRVFKDAYLGAADPKEPLLPAFSPPLGGDGKNPGKVELRGDEAEAQDLLGEYPSLPELQPLEDAVLPAAPQPPPAYNVHFLSSLLAPHRSPAVVPLGAWAREGAVEIKEAGAAITSNNLEEASFQNPLAQESCSKFPSSQEAEDASVCSHKKDSNPMVICQLKGGTQMLCIDNSGTRELKALHLVPQYPDQNNYLQSDVPKPMTTLVGRFLPVPAKLNLITQLDNGALPSVVNGSAFPSGSTLPGPPKITLACLDRNPEAFQPKIGKGKLGDVKPRHNKGCNCKRSGCLKNYCECYEAKIMCSSICKCIGCKNYEESPERKTLMNLPNYMDIGGFEGGHHLSPTKLSGLPTFRKDRRSPSCISWEVVEATCACLLAQGEEAERERCSERLAEQRVLEEFGRCLSQILHTEFKSKGLNVE
uniref:CRC domain-containing protein n=1 Tax=Sus scrofa TaxID=9823 RepID=A0A8D1P8F6_PIG